MTRSPETPAPNSRTTTYALAAAVVFIAYPLSLGPATWLDKSGILSRGAMDAILAIYYPIDVLYMKSSFIQRLVDWYLDFWV